MVQQILIFEVSLFDFEVSYLIECDQKIDRKTVGHRRRRRDLPIICEPEKTRPVTSPVTKMPIFMPTEYTTEEPSETRRTIRTTDLRGNFREL